jgi:Diiron non-heme beta-hydroxylase N-terminal domain
MTMQTAAAGTSRAKDCFNLHLRLMESFLANPQVHVAALKNPAMLRGPFLNFDEGKVPGVARMLEKTRCQAAPLLEFTDAVRDLTRILTTRADGSSLQPLYYAVPEPLKGFVELVYDVNNQPAIRFIEPLLYRSRYYDESAQSIESAQGNALAVVDGDDRPFVFSTPLVTAPLARRVDQSRRLDALDCERAMGPVTRLRPHAVHVYAMGSEPSLTYLTSIHYTEQSRPIVQSRALMEEWWVLGVPAGTLFGKKEVVFQ